ncbi:MAG: hypothetical protein EP346_08545 [Bacteroidetes bacterium]|nr:MAG: hypothetical protein EP346_08545 [Bacteroidota bacterium]
MKSGFTNWLKAKLDSFEDTPTPSDWAAMEQMINSQPSLVAKPWYRSLGGVSGIVLSTAVVIGSIFWFTSENAESTQLDAQTTPAIVNTPSGSTSNLSPSTISNTSLENNSSTESSPSVSPSSEVTSPLGTNRSIGADASSENTMARVGQNENQDVYTRRNSALEAGESSRTLAQQRSSEEGGAVPTTSDERSNTVSADPYEIASTESTLANSSDEKTGSTAVNSESTFGENMEVRGEGESTTTPSRPSSSSNDASSSEANAASVAEEMNDNGGGNTTATAEEAGANHPSNAETEEKPSSAVIRNSSNQPSPWSITAYGTFAATSTPPTTAEGNVLYEVTSPVGFGLEADYRIHGWKFSSGLSYLTESQKTTHYEYTEQEILSSLSWYEWDTTYTQVVDSTWQITGINTGRWVYDTTMTYTTDSILKEKGDTVLVRTETADMKQMNGYRISVPLMVGMEWEYGKWSTSIQAGPILTFSSTQWYQGEVYRSTHNSIGVDLAARMELGYSITPHWQGIFRLGYRTNATPYSDYRKAAWTRNSVPLSLGVRYRF